MIAHLRAERPLQSAWPMSTDRRRTPRVPCDLPAHWKLQSRVIAARAVDLNADGLFLRTDSIVAENHLMDLAVTLPHTEVSFFGVARYVGASRHGHGIGVKIHAISREDREAWMRYYRLALERMLDTLPPAIARHLRAP